jgi:hypothetical protein
MRSTHHEAELNFAGQRRQQTEPQVQHKVKNDQYYARGNACMHQHHQAKIQGSAAKMATSKFLLIWLWEVANSVIGKQGELLEY